MKKYESFIRDILNSTVARINWDKLEQKNQLFTEKIMELFKTENSLGWSFYCSCLDTLSDSNIAITSFANNKFELCGKIPNGQHYLLIYGILSAVYINQGAIITLTDLVKIKTNELDSAFKSTKISFLRKALAAHPTDFMSNDQKVNFKMVRNSIGFEDKIQVVNSKTQTESHNITEAINEYIYLAENTLEQVCRKILKIRYKANNEKQNELVLKLNEISHGQ